jgi:hypothetical protein
MQGLLMEKSSTPRSIRWLIVVLLLIAMEVLASVFVVGGHAYAASATIVVHSVTGSQIPIGQTGSVTASCQPGEYLLGGGYETSAFETVNITENYPSSANS